MRGKFVPFRRNDLDTAKTPGVGDDPAMGGLPSYDPREQNILFAKVLPSRIPFHPINTRASLVWLSAGGVANR